MEGKEAKKNVFTICAGESFSKVFAQYLLEETDSKAELLAQYKILLPTRRACRILRDTFLDLNDGEALLLPQMRPIGDIDGDDLSLNMFGHSQVPAQIPPAISPLRRQLLLCRLIQQVPTFQSGNDRALALAKALSRFMDQVIVEGLSFKKLYTLVPADFAAHWGITLDFLKIISETWPKILEEEGTIEAADRRNRLLRLYKDFLDEKRPTDQIIAAGAIGSIPAVADVLCSIASLPNGRVILPGMDTNLEMEVWEDVEVHHPQYFFKSLLRKMDMAYHDVEIIGRCQSHRAGLARDMMLPAQHTHRWKKAGHASLEGLEYYACSSQEEEAMVIACIIREVLEDPGRRKDIVALVTPDRRLARRVMAHCLRWGISADDSAGMSLDQSRLGVFCLLFLQALRRPFDVIAFLSFLKHPFCRMGYGRLEYRRCVTVLERDIFRTRNKPIFKSLDDLSVHVGKNDYPEFLKEFLRNIISCASPVLCLSADEKDFGILLSSVLQAIENFAARQTAKDTLLSGEDLLWRGDDGETAARFFSDLLSEVALVRVHGLGDVAPLLQNLMRDVNVRSAYGVHPRVLILGQLEARLSHADVTILGELNDGVWPAGQEHDPWMSRPMRSAFGLPDNAQKTGLAAHDFVQGFCNKRVIMTRSEKMNGSPTVMSPWLMRLNTVLQAQGRNLSDLSIGSYRTWVRLLDKAEDVMPFQRPAPIPPFSARLRRVSVTKFETWIQNPYALYMYYILKIRASEAIRTEFGAAQFGSVLHDALDVFVKQYPITLPEQGEDLFLKIVDDVLQTYMSEQDIPAYWRPRFEIIARWFIQHEEGWRVRAKFKAAEVVGEMALDVNGHDFVISGRADRVDLMHGENGAGYALIDYKSAGAFKEKKLKNGELPQLPLEAMMLEKGAFEGLGAGHTHYIGYWKLSGGKMGGEVVSIEGKLDETVAKVKEAVIALIEMFWREDLPFYAVPDLTNAPRYNDYEHVSRLKEWAALDDESGGDGL